MVSRAGTHSQRNRVAPLLGRSANRRPKSPVAAAEGAAAVPRPAQGTGDGPTLRPVLRSARALLRGIPALIRRGGAEEDGTGKADELEGEVWPNGETAEIRHELRVCLLGPFSTSIDGQPLAAWPSNKAKALFKYLVTHRRRRVPREQLMEALWPGGDLEASSNSLRVAVHALRQVLAAASGRQEREAFILFEGNAYTFSCNLEFSVDMEEFERRWQVGRILAKEDDWDRATKEFEAAESLYQGDFLEDDPYEEWTLVRREALRDVQLAILGKLAESFFKLGDYEGCILRCQKILEHDTRREDVYQWLMRCHAGLGQPGRVRQWYETCVRIFEREFGLAPSRETRELYRQLMGGPSAAYPDIDSLQ